jgi:hypothetical protein
MWFKECVAPSWGIKIGHWELTIFTVSEQQIKSNNVYDFLVHKSKGQKIKCPLYFHHIISTVFHKFDH